MLALPHLDPQRVRTFSRREYDQLVELGMFQDERLELLDGLLVTMSPQGEPHARITAWFARELILTLGRSYEVRSHSPFAATDDSEPEPDISVSRIVSSATHPSAALLIIEVSDSSLRIDRRIKAPIYAQSGAPEYWIVDVQQRLVEVRSQPDAGEYTRIDRLSTGTLRPTQLPGVALALADIPWPPG